MSQVHLSLVKRLAYLHVGLIQLIEYLLSSLYSEFFWMSLVLPEHEVSFTLNLYPDGYSIAKPPEVSLKNNNCPL